MRGVQTSPETQERVRKAAEELGYTGNAVARALARGSTGLVGVLSGSLEDLSEQRFVESLGRQLGRHDLHMVVVDARGEPERERMLARQLADQLVDGLIVSPLDPSDPSWADIGEALPIVTVGDALAGPTVGEVLFDNRAGVGIVLDHLHALGTPPHRGADPEPPVDARPPGRARRRPSCATRSGSTRPWSTRRTRSRRRPTRRPALLAREPRPTAVFCLSDSIACGVYAAAAAARPGDPARPLGRRLRRPPDRGRRRAAAHDRGVGDARRRGLGGGAARRPPWRAGRGRSRGAGPGRCRSWSSGRRRRRPSSCPGRVAAQSPPRAPPRRAPPPRACRRAARRSATAIPSAVATSQSANAVFFGSSGPCM